jgi:uncharacterized protein (DUF302 family)
MTDAPEAGTLPSAPGTVSVRSPFSVTETVERLTGVIKARGIELFAALDQSAAARGAGLEMNETVLLVFGSPRGGTPVMRARPLIALELPLKAVVWADDEGRVWVSHHDMAETGRRYRVPEELMKPLLGVGALVSAALGD